MEDLSLKPADIASSIIEDAGYSPHGIVGVQRLRILLEDAAQRTLERVVAKHERLEAGAMQLALDVNDLTVFLRRMAGEHVPSPLEVVEDPRALSERERMAAESIINEQRTAAALRSDPWGVDPGPTHD